MDQHSFGHIDGDAQVNDDPSLRLERKTTLSAVLFPAIRPKVVKGAARLRQASAAAAARGSRTGERRMPQPLRRPIQGIMASLQRLRSGRRANAWRGIKLPGATS